MVLDKTTAANPKLDCQALASVEMEVPAGATVQVQTRDGDIMIAGVAGAYAGSQNGDITIERATKLVEAGSVGGSISLKRFEWACEFELGRRWCRGRLMFGPATDEDTFEVGTVSGDIQLDRVSNPKVTAKTVNGTLTMTGPLAKSGYYGFTNMTGDVVLAMPHDASFQLNAKVSEKHDIVSDFALKYLSERRRPRRQRQSPEAKPKPPDGKGKSMPRTGPVVAPIMVEKPDCSRTRIAPSQCDLRTGDATIPIASFGGTVRLKKI